MSFLDRLRECDNAGALDAYLPFCVADLQIGWVHREFAPLLAPFDDVFAAANGTIGLSRGVRFP